MRDSEGQKHLETIGYQRWLPSEGRYEYLCGACIIRYNRPMKEFESFASDDSRICSACNREIVGTAEV